MRTALFVLLVAMLLLSNHGAVAYEPGTACGLLPLKPIPPIGCKDLKPQCVCNERGEKCRWEWLCVK